MTKVLVFYRYYYPGTKAGGPVVSLRNLFSALGEQIEFKLATTNTDLHDDEEYCDCPVGIWVEKSDARVLYLRQKVLTIGLISSIISQEKPHLVYLNSCFDPQFTLRLLFGRLLGLIESVPVILAPRGELHQGSLSHKRFKKRVFLFIANLIGLYRGLIWQASTTMEAEDIKAAFRGVSRSSIKVAQDVPSLPTHWKSNDQSSKIHREKLRLCFLSRISPTKNLDYAIKVVSKLTCNVEFRVYGYKEFPQYFEHCQKLAESLPTNVEVKFLGPVDSADVVSVMSDNDVFLFPTKGENYGHVISEAMTAGLIVITSDRVPWGEAADAGMITKIPLNCPDKYSKEIERLSRQSRSEIEGLKKKIRAFKASSNEFHDAKEANLKLFNASRREKDTE